MDLEKSHLKKRKNPVLGMFDLKGTATVVENVETTPETVGLKKKMQGKISRF